MASSVETLSSFADDAETAGVYTVEVRVPASLSAGPVYFDVAVRNIITSAQWDVKRRYTDFESVQSELRWEHNLELAEFPAKRPPPKYDRALLNVRATGLQAWAIAVIQNSEAIHLARCAAHYSLAFLCVPPHVRLILFVVGFASASSSCHDC